MTVNHKTCALISPPRGRSLLGRTRYDAAQEVDLSHAAESSSPTAISGRFVDQERIDGIFDWLVDGAQGTKNAIEVIAKLAPEMIAAGVPIQRVVAFVRTLHPHIVGRSFVWLPGGHVEVSENSYAYLQSPGFLSSPVAAVFRTGQLVRRDLTARAGSADSELLQDLAKQGFTDYYAAPLTFLSGQVHAITFATRAAEGFTDSHIAAIAQVVRPLARIAEILALSRTAVNLLNTYVGHDAGERILQGRIQLGDTESLQAVVWFSDLRGFTSLSADLAPPAIIRVLNDLFECQVTAIEACGGQVLKFIGDGLLAIFPLKDNGAGPVCDKALQAANDAFTALALLNADRAIKAEPPIRFGLALHVGEIAYGNIGGSGRLDFTVIGPAVNLAARLEGLTSSLQRDLVLSREFAEATSAATLSLGEFALKGVAEAIEVFAAA